MHLRYVSLSGILCCLCLMMACKQESSPSISLTDSQVDSISNADSVEISSWVDKSSPFVMPDACERLTMKQVVSHFPGASAAHIDNRRKEHSTTCTYTWTQGKKGEYSIALTLQKALKASPDERDLINSSKRKVWVKDGIVYSLTISDQIESKYLVVIRSGIK